MPYPHARSSWLANLQAGSGFPSPPVSGLPSLAIVSNYFRGDGQAGPLAMSWICQKTLPTSSCTPGTAY